MITLLYSALLFTATGQERHPILHFDAGQRVALRRQCQEDRTFWPRVLQEAEGLIAPGAVDPATVATGHESTPVNVRGHMFGRRLTGWVEPLGFAYQITGDRRFGELGARLLVSAAKGLPPDKPPVGPNSFAGARGDILRGLTIGYDWLYEALTPSERVLVAEAMAAYIRSILDEAEKPRIWWVPHHNFIGVAVGAAGLASIALADRFPQEAPRWRERATILVSRWLNEGFDEKGAYYEGVLYSLYGLDNGILFADALRRAGGPDLFAHPRLRQLPRFLAFSLLPGERVYDALNDSNYSGSANATLLRLSAGGDGLARWLWQESGGAEGKSPFHVIWANNTAPVDPQRAGLPWAEHFPGRGLAVFRTGWGADDIMFSLESGPYYPVTHNQADKCQVTLYGKGGRWLIDSGYGNNLEPEGKAQTVAHNLVLVDGKGQALSGAGTGTNGKILAFEAKETHGYVLGDATEAYQRNSRGQVGVALTRAHRHALFARPGANRPAYAILVDDLRVDGAPHTFDWLLHTDAENDVAVEGSTVRLQGSRGPSGGAFIETPWGSTERGRAEFTLTVPADGRYRVWGRIRAGGPDPQKSDSFFLQWDDAEPVAWHAPARAEWSWAAMSALGSRVPMEFPLTAGQHRLTVLTREAGAALDRLVITSDPSWVPVSSPAPLMLEAEDAVRVVAPMVVRREQNAPAGQCLVQWLVPAEVQISRDGYAEHPRLRARTTATDPVFVTLLVPRRPEEPQPRAQATCDAERVTVTLTWESGVDEVVFARDGSQPARYTRRPR